MKDITDHFVEKVERIAHKHLNAGKEEEDQAFDAALERVYQSIEKTAEQALTK